MLRLSRLTDYAVVVLSQMAKTTGTVVNAVDLADATALPQPTVAKVLKLLARRSVVESVRGAQGGYVLKRPADRVSVAEIISAIDGPVALTACVDEADGDCSVEQLCPMRGRWDRLNTAVQAAFESVTLAEIAAAPTVPDFIHIEPQPLDAPAREGQRRPTTV